MVTLSARRDALTVPVRMMIPDTPGPVRDIVVIVEMPARVMMLTVLPVSPHTAREDINIVVEPYVDTDRPGMVEHPIPEKGSVNH
jgi:hypothetical protein